ncbi:acyltransferase family protein [Mucilaginibacter lacusdianchii]|uniref:acyltransferase family protein n=1 Tax=Mucilaginibacter lacusdianchii TaxID=2684211 RepID=UPI00131CD6A8|nr:acyltransferase [Mucilaginibacter sp. JXJ CY 39]
MTPKLLNKEDKIFFANLDGLRFLAFMAVFIQHTNNAWVANLHFYRHYWDRVLNLLLHLGAQGVSFFFVLSGFLITYLLLQETEKKGRVNVVYFYIRRALRIWPLYYLLVILEFTVFPIICKYAGLQTTPGISPLYVVTFLSNFNFLDIAKASGFHHTMLGPIWSVAVEEQFYFIWPLLFYFIPKKFYKYIFPAIVVLCYVFRYQHRADGSTMYFHTLSVCGDLAIGGLFAYYAFYSTKFKSWFQNLTKLQTALIYFLGFCWLLFSSQTHHAQSVGLFMRIGNCLLFAFVILEQNYNQRSLFKLSNNRFMSKWGKYTYGLYLLHPIGVDLATEVGNKYFGAYSRSLFINELAFRLIALIISFVVSYVSYEFFEKHFLKLKDRFAIVKTRSHTKEASTITSNATDETLETKLS